MSLSRRDFIEGAVATGAALTVLPAVGCGNDVQPAPYVDNGQGGVSYDGANTTTVADYSTISDLVSVGGAITMRPLPPGKPLANPALDILLIHRGTAMDPPEWVAFQSQCTHQQCPLGYQPQDKLIECPCHGSRFRVLADLN